MNLIKGTALCNADWPLQNGTNGGTKRFTVWLVEGLETASDCTYVTSFNNINYITILSGVFSDFIPEKK